MQEVFLIFYQGDGIQKCSNTMLLRFIELYPLYIYAFNFTCWYLSAAKYGLLLDWRCVTWLSLHQVFSVTAKQIWFLNDPYNSLDHPVLPLLLFWTLIFLEFCQNSIKLRATQSSNENPVYWTEVALLDWAYIIFCSFFLNAKQVWFWNNPYNPLPLPVLPLLLLEP